MKIKYSIIVFMLFLLFNVVAKNPIIPNKGANDPHIRIINGKAYLSASHDKSIENSTFIMEDWWLWSSDDLVNWKLESVLKPEDTYIGKPFAGCWATDIAYRNGKYYWYFSERNEQSGVVVSDSPKDPWTDPLNKPLLSSDMTPTHEYDMGIIEDEQGEFYIVFGVWDYYIARLNEDMISLAETPRRIIINNPHGPYNQDGKNEEKPTDDKPFMHLHNGKYYLSWGCFYAMSDNIYGPFEYKGSIIDSSSFAKGYDTPTWPNGFLQGRHGSFFDWHNQSYFAYCDISQTGNRYFRDTFVSYIHYKENGEIAVIRIDGIGVGEYDANSGPIEAENYFLSEGLKKHESTCGSFGMGNIDENDYLIFPNIYNLNNKSHIEFKCINNKECTIEIYENSPKGKLLQTCVLRPSKRKETSQSFKLPTTETIISLCFVFKPHPKDDVHLDSFSIK